MLAGRVSSRHHVGLLQLQLGGVLDGDDALVSGMNDDRQLSRVVLPEPVPPETRMFRRARTMARSTVAICGVSEPTLDQVGRP